MDDLTLRELPLFGDAYFSGADYQAARDKARLTGQIGRIYNLMRDGAWRSLAVIARETGDPEASISAQLRNLRKPSFGSHVIERDYVDNGLYVYRLVLK